MANEILMSLLSPEQRSQAQEDAFRQGLLGLSTGLIQAAIPQGGRRTSTLQALAQAAPGAVGAYKGAFDQTLKDLLTGMQVKDMLAKREREKQIQAIAGKLFQPQMGQVPTTIPTETYEDYKTTVPGVTGVEINKSMLPALGALGPEGMQYASNLAAFQKAMQPEERVMKPGEVLYRGGQEVMRVPETTPTGIREYTYALENKLIPPGTTYTDFKKAGAMSITMPSEGERKAAVLANRIQFNVNNISDVLGKKPSAATPQELPTIIQSLTGSDYLASLTKDEDRQRVEAAQIDILDAALTLGTGAAYTREQLEGYRKAYFPQLEDKGKPQVIADKQARLQNLLESAFMAAGRAAPTIGQKPAAAAPAPAGPVAQNQMPTLNDLINAAIREKASRK